MVNNYTIKMTPKAAYDLENIYKYLSEELFATSAATNILERIEEEIMRLRAKTIKTHLQNVDFYINEFLLREQPLEMESGCGENMVEWQHDCAVFNNYY